MAAAKPRVRSVAARFLERPNRFVVIAELPGRQVVEAHLGDPGRLTDLLLPGAALRLRPEAPRPGRRTAFTVVLVREGRPPRPWVGVETGRANQLAAGLIERGALRGIGPSFSVQREVRCGSSRLDFRLDRGRTRLWIEVKSVTWVRDGVGLFPDAPTSRGRRHLAELEGRVRANERGLVLFVAQRADARSVAPHAGVDPEFVRGLAEARRAGVELQAVRFRMRSDGRAIFGGQVPVDLPNPGR